MSILFLLCFMLVTSECVAYNALKSNQRMRLRTLSTITDESVVEDKAITIAPKAIEHLTSLVGKIGQDKYLRMGVKAGGCSGMSYVMDFISSSDVLEDDHIESYGPIKCVMDPKSMLYLYGLQLDYSDALIGGGFKFINPNSFGWCQ